jgi:hypothetical protein
VTVLAYKFLRPGAIGPFSGFLWPTPSPFAPAGTPGPWVEASPFRGACGGGIHGCDADHLVYWLERELWLVELDGDVAASNKKLIAPRGRLVRRLTAWDDSLARALTDACIERARSLAGAATGPDAALARGYVDDAVVYSTLDVSASLFCCAHAALTEDAFARERTWQSRWLAARLPLSPPPLDRAP